MKENVDIDRCLFNENQYQDGSKNIFELHKPVVR